MAHLVDVLDGGAAVRGRGASVAVSDEAGESSGDEALRGSIATSATEEGFLGGHRRPSGRRLTFPGEVAATGGRAMACGGSAGADAELGVSVWAELRDALSLG